MRYTDEDDTLLGLEKARKGRKPRRWRWQPAPAHPGVQEIAAGGVQNQQLQPQRRRGVGSRQLHRPRRGIGGLRPRTGRSWIKSSWRRW